MKTVGSIVAALLLCVPLWSCVDDQNEPVNAGNEEDGGQDTGSGWDYPAPVHGGRSRIAWDSSTLVKMFQPGNYSRVIDLGNGNLVAVAGAVQGGVGVTRSQDYGASWSEAVVVAPQRPGIKMSVPEIMKCSNGNLLLTYNPRPDQPNGDPENLKYGIRARISEDSGATWSDEIFVYDAGGTDDGCWEPQTIELPSGEIHCYFANEYDYPGSNDQNISLCRSTDGGRTWSGREIVSYRKGHRDGMPVAIYMEDTREIIVAIEDNGWHTSRMQPSIIRTSDNWASGTVLAGSANREYALAEELDAVDNAAAPYICRAKTGEIILSYQGTEDRDVPMQANGVKSTDYTQEMFVAVGDASGRGFTNKTTPFNLPLGPEPGDRSGFQGMWNSVAQLSDGTIFAVTSTNAYEYPKGGVWGMKGYLLNDIYPGKAGGISIDADTADWDGAEPALVVAHVMSSRVYCYAAKNEGSLDLMFTGKTNTVSPSYYADDIKDGFEFIIAPASSGQELRIAVPFDGNIFVDGSISLPSGFVYDRDTGADGTFVFECSIPKDYLDGKGLSGLSPVNLVLYDSDGNGAVDTGTVVHSDMEDKSTWLSVYL